MASRKVLVRTGADLGIAVAEARRAQGFTQAELANLAGISRGYLAKLETGLSVTLLDRALRVLRRLGAQVTVELPEIPETPDAPETSTAPRKTP